MLSFEDWLSRSYLTEYHLSDFFSEYYYSVDPTVYQVTALNHNQNRIIFSLPVHDVAPCEHLFSSFGFTFNTLTHVTMVDEDAEFEDYKTAVEYRFYQKDLTFIVAFRYYSHYCGFMITQQLTEPLHSRVFEEIDTELIPDELIEKLIVFEKQKPQLRLKMLFTMYPFHREYMEY